MQRPHLLSLALVASIAHISLAALGCAGTGHEAAQQPGSTPLSHLSRTRAAFTLAPKTLALTFDDGPGDRTVELADYLASEGIQAVFFINGKNVPGRQGVLDAVVGDGHLIGNHTQNHLSLTSLGPDQIVDEVTQTDAFLSALNQDGPLLLRPPFLDWSDEVRDTLQGSPMSAYRAPVMADLGTQLTDTAAADWACWDANMTTKECADRYLMEIDGADSDGNPAGDGLGRGVVLMHDPYGDDQGSTVDMVKMLVPILKERGYSFVRADAVPDLTDGF